MRSVRWGLTSVPPLATAAATMAIWRGVASRPPWPIATRPMSTWLLDAGVRPLDVNTPLT